MPDVPGAARRNLLVRLATVAVLAPLTIAIAYVGGIAWIAVATLVAAGLLIEWLALVGAKRSVAVLIFGGATLLEVAVCAALHKFTESIAVTLLGMLAVALAVPGRRGWSAAGVAYAAAALIASVWLRHEAEYGFAAVLFVLLVVWATDSGGYFAGRGIGGPKLWPSVSPNKTWAGAVGSVVAALAVAGGFIAAGYGRAMPLLAVALVLSVASQVGDLFESGVKRRFGVKDSGTLIPGHGGLLDRLDGFVAAVILAAAIGALRGGSDGAARGLMLW